MIHALVLALATSLPTVAPASAVCDVPRLHAYATEGATIVAGLKKSPDKVPVYARLGTLVANADGCARAALTRLGSSFDDVDSTLAFEAIARRMRMRVVRAEAEIFYRDLDLARIDVRDVSYDLGSMSDYTREHESAVFAERQQTYNRFIRDVRRLSARIRHEEVLQARANRARPTPSPYCGSARTPAYVSPATQSIAVARQRTPSCGQNA